MLAVLFLLLSAQPASPSNNSEVGSQACAPCHAGIYRSYQATGMARSSGRPRDGGFREQFSSASFEDTHSGAKFDVRENYRFSYRRPSTVLKGIRSLDWFIGSGKVGRSYASSVDGFLFQAPVSYYSSAGKWDLSPGYAGGREVNLARPIEPACLHCHSTGVRHIPGTQNRYEDPPVREGGIGCERCHGPGGLHIGKMRSGKRDGDPAIVNPARLGASRRDSICLQCHLTGVARVARRNRAPGSYRPGDLLSDHLAVFVWSSAEGERAATDHAEQLSRSKCRQASGERLWCGSCHDPHATPAAADRTAFYRTACLQCHANQNPCAGERSARSAAGDDCASCHMPKGSSREGQHVVYTDHSIVRTDMRRKSAQVRELTLLSFWKTPADQRDLALAYASIAPGEPRVRPVALGLLEKALDMNPNDTVLLAQLAEFYDRLGNPERAIPLYERVLGLDALHPAAANLAIHRVGQGRTGEAISLWRNLFQRNPAMAGPGVNLALELFRSGDLDGAEASVLRVLRYHPDLEVAGKLLDRIRARRAETAIPRK